MTPTPPQMSSRGRDTVLALLNIENQQDRIGALSNVLTNSHNLGLRNIGILAVVESFVYAHEGTVVMLGDFNGHIPSTTGDKSTRPVTSHNNKLSHMINTLPGSGNKPDTN
jgi:hypothetical protein